MKQKLITSTNISYTLVQKPITTTTRMQFNNYDDTASVHNLSLVRSTEMRKKQQKLPVITHLAINCSADVAIHADHTETNSLASASQKDDIILLPETSPNAD